MQDAMTHIGIKVALLLEHIITDRERSTTKTRAMYRAYCIAPGFPILSTAQSSSKLQVHVQLGHNKFNTWPEKKFHQKFSVFYSPGTELRYFQNSDSRDETEQKWSVWSWSNPTHKQRNILPSFYCSSIEINSY